MKPIPTKVHGVLDYVTGVTLIMAPSILNFAGSSAAARIPLFLGIAVIGYSLLTRYELGLIKAIPMPAHLLLDMAGGLFLAASPWLFGFADHVWKPHVFIGAFEIVAAAMTRSTPYETSRMSAHGTTKRPRFGPST